MSVKRVEYHEGATADVRMPSPGIRKQPPRRVGLIEEPDRAADTIREAPDRWPAGRNNTRRFLLWRFPLSIIYSEHESVITVWAVAHGSRRPEY